MPYERDFRFCVASTLPRPHPAIKRLSGCGSRLHRSKPRKLAFGSRQLGHRRLASWKMSCRDGACPVSDRAECSVRGWPGSRRGRRRGKPRLYGKIRPTLPYRPLNLHPSSGTVNLLSPSPAFLIPHRQFARNSCSMCATKGVVSMGPTICGVLLLDPSPYSPLELVKSGDDIPGSWGRHPTMRPARNLGS